MKTGTVKWFNKRKGYGFLTDSDGNEYFVHYSQIIGEGFKALTEGQSVSFDVGIGSNDKEQALNVQAVA